MRVFPSNPEGHKTTHGKAGDSPVFPVRNGTVMVIDIINELRKIKWKLAKSFYGPYIIWPHIIFFIRTPVIPVRLNYNNFMGRHKIRNIITIVLTAFIKTCITLASISEITLRPAMEKIDHRIFFLRIIKIARR